MSKRDIITDVAIGLATVLLLAALGTMAGCTMSSLDAFRQQNPTMGMRPVDENNDGQPDTYVVVDSDGAPVKDAEGKLVEVAGARADITTDEAFGNELAAWGAAFGIPGLGIAGLFWNKSRRWRLALQDVVLSVQDYRDTQTPEAKAQMTEKLLNQSIETRKLVADAKNLGK